MTSVPSQAPLPTPKYVVETARIGRPYNLEQVSLYLNSKPLDWKLVNWKWANVPSGATTDQNWCGVEATWEVPS